MEPDQITDTDPRIASHWLPKSTAVSSQTPVLRRTPRIETLRRHALLDELGVPTDGPVRLATRVNGIPGRIARRRAAVGGVLLSADVLAATGVLTYAAASRIGQLVPVGVAMFVVALRFMPLGRERRSTSARHGKDYHLLSVRTRTGVRTIDLARLIHIEERSRSVWVLDAEGVTVVITSGYGRQAVKTGIKRWGMGQAVPCSAAQRRVALKAARGRLRHPLCRRRGRAEFWLTIE